MSKKLKIGIIGIGTIADIHAQSIQKSSNLQLVSAFSRNSKNVKEFGIKHQITAHSNWEAFISDPDLDAVSICTPNGTHLEYGLRSAKAKKHVIVEKPIEITIERAKKLIETCKTNHVALAVIYQNRFTDGMLDLKKMLDNNKLGKLFMGDAHIKWFRSQEYYDSGNWRGSLDLDGGGVLINQAIHTIDLLQWLMGDVESVFGRIGTFTHQLEGEDNAIATLQFKNGGIGNIQASTSIQPAQSRRIEIHGEKGTVIIDGDDITMNLTDEKLSSKKNKEKTKESSGSSSPLGGFSIKPHQKQFEAISEAILNQKSPPVSGEESLRSLGIVLGIYQSNKNNISILMEDIINRVKF